MLRICQQKQDPITKYLWMMECQQIEQVSIFPTILFSLQQSVHETGEPRRLCMTPEGSKPHLPVQPGLVRSDHRRGCAEVAWLVHKLNLLPKKRRLVMQETPKKKKRVKSVATLTVHVTPSRLPSMTTSGRPPTPVILLNRPYELTSW